MRRRGRRIYLEKHGYGAQGQMIARGLVSGIMLEQWSWPVGGLVTKLSRAGVVVFLPSLRHIHDMFFQRPTSTAALIMEWLGVFIHHLHKYSMTVSKALIGNAQTMT